MVLPIYIYIYNIHIYIYVYVYVFRMYLYMAMSGIGYIYIHIRGIDVGYKKHGFLLVAFPESTRSLVLCIENFAHHFSCVSFAYERCVSFS